MSSLPYYKRYTKDFLDGTAGMSGEVKGAYSVLLDLIYIQSGKLPDDPHYISGNLGYSVRKWNAIKKELIKRGKIEVKNGIISNKRADKEQIILSKYQDNQAENRSKPNKNKDLTISTVDTVYNTETEPETEDNSLRSLSNSSLLSASAKEEKNNLPSDVNEETVNLMLDALGVTDETKTHGLLVWTEIYRWFENGCDLEKDILPVLKAKAAQGHKATNWAYFTKAIFQAKANREAPPPEVSGIAAHSPYEDPVTKLRRDLDRRMAEEEQEANNVH